MFRRSFYKYLKDSFLHGGDGGDTPTPPTPPTPTPEYVPTTRNGDGLYGLIDGEYVPLTCTTSTTESWYYWATVSGKKVKTYLIGSTYPSYDSNTGWATYSKPLNQITDNEWNIHTFAYYDGGNYKEITREKTTTYRYSYNGTTYTGQRYEKVE